MTAINDYARAFAGEGRCDGIADTGRAAGDEGQFVFELEVHGVGLSKC